MINTNELMLGNLVEYKGKYVTICLMYEGIVAVTNNRKYIGIELKKSYFDASIKNLKSAELSKTQATLL